MALLFLFCFLLAIPSVFSAEERDLLGAENHWLEKNQNVFDGTCFGEDIVLRYSDPVTIVSTDWDTHFLTSWVAKILLEEVMGYQVLINDEFQGGAATFELMGTGGGDLNLELWPVGKEALYDTWITQQGSVSDIGNSGFLGRDGWFATTKMVYLFDTYYLDFWKALQLDSVVQLVGNETWQPILQDPSLIRKMTGEYVCEDDDTRRANGELAAGCTDGLFIPPQCLPDPESQCLVLYAYTPNFVPGFLQDQILNLNLKVTIAFITNEIYTSFVQSRSSNFMFFYWFTPDLVFTCTTTDVNSTIPFPCFSRVTLPDSSEACTSQATQEPGSPVDCDFDKQTMIKLGSERLVSLPAAYEFSREFSLSDTDVNDLLVSFGENLDYKQSACLWLQQNEIEWVEWIPEPEECTIEDLNVTFSTCHSNSKSLVSYQFSIPKSCEGGISLPDEEMTDCDVIPLESGKSFWLLFLMTLCLILISFFSVFISIFRKHPVFDYVSYEVVGYFLTLLGCVLILCSVLVIFLGQASAESSFLPEPSSSPSSSSSSSSSSAFPDTVCQTQFWLFALGFSFITSSLYFISQPYYRRYRHRLLTANSYNVLSNLIIRCLGPIFFVNFFILIIVQILVPSQVTNITLEILESGSPTSYFYCERSPIPIFVFFLTNLIFSLFLLRRLLQIYVLKIRFPSVSFLWILQVLMILVLIFFCFIPEFSPRVVPSLLSFIQSTIIVTFILIFLILFIFPKLILFYRFRKSDSSQVLDLKLNSLEIMLENDISGYFFWLFCQKKHSSESFEFYRDVADYRRSLNHMTRTDTESILYAKFIVKKYLTHGSEYEINLGFDIRKETIEAVQSMQTAIPNVFISAQNEIGILLKQNFLDAFLSSEFGTQTNDLIDWSRQFEELDEGVQKAVLKNFKKTAESTTTHTTRVTVL
eukprot:Lithocolla_globosa_v1_NODE_467_length_3967_cov_144.951687.p1 type:complete len:926 gc:universal NODE_467_length_3967_cov_144.951687:953-3730(+)